MKRILVVKKRALGDSIMGLSALQYLKELYPDALISYAIPKWMIGLYDNVETAADEIIPIESNLSFYSKLLELRPDMIHELHQSGSSAKVLSLYSFFKNIPYTFHNHHSTKESPIKDQGKPKAAIQRDLDGVAAFYPSNRYPNFLAYPPKMKVEAVQKQKRIILGVVATRQTKMWPLGFYKDLCRMLEQKGFEVIIPLGPGDQNIQKNLVGFPTMQIPLKQLAKVFSESALYVGNDTGIKHLAVAVGTPSLTFFGPENPSEWHPYDSSLHPYFFKEGLECRTLKAHYCALSTCDSMICLNQFTPEMTYQKVLEMVSL